MTTFIHIVGIVGVLFLLWLYGNHIYKKREGKKK